MFNAWVTYFLAMLIVLQSVMALADTHKEDLKHAEQHQQQHQHNIEVTGISTDHLFSSDNISIDIDLTDQASHVDCHHSHCHHSNFVFIQLTENSVFDTLKKHPAYPINIQFNSQSIRPDLRPPIV